MPLTDHDSSSQIASTSLHARDGEINVAARLQEQRQRAQQFLQQQRERLSALDQDLLENLSAIRRQTTEWSQFQETLQKQQEELQTELRQTSEHHQSLELRDSELQQKESKLRHARKDLAQRIVRHRQRIRSDQDGVTTQVNDEINELRHKIAQLDEQSVSDRREKESLIAAREELSQLQTRLEAELNTTRGLLVEQRGEEKELRQQLARSRTLLNERAQQITDLRSELEGVMRTHAEQEAQRPAVDVSEFLDLRKERDELREQVATLQQLQKQIAEQSGDQSDYESLQRRFDILVDKARDLKNRNAELEQELKSWRGGENQPPSNAPFDWEKQKNQMLRQLDGKPPEADESDAATPSAKATLNHAAELEQEREQLKKLQDEWHEKLRSAEVEISIERAENARVRSQLQDKMRDLEAKLAAIEKQSEKETGHGGKPRRRWMDRLGLSGDDE